eukprot:scaffold2858_cov659-Pavlova_lutheri.AAC.196
MGGLERDPTGRFPVQQGEAVWSAWDTVALPQNGWICSSGGTEGAGETRVDARGCAGTMDRREGSDGHGNARHHRYPCTRHRNLVLGGPPAGAFGRTVPGIEGRRIVIDISRPKPTTTTIQTTRGRHGERVARGVSSLPVEGDESMAPSRWNDEAKVKHPRAEHEEEKEQDAFDALVALEGLLWEWWGLLAT